MSNRSPNQAPEATGVRGRPSDGEPLSGRERSGPVFGSTGRRRGRPASPPETVRSKRAVTFVTEAELEKLQSLADRLDDPDQIDTCRDEVRRIRDDKWTSFRLVEGSCCLAAGPDVSLFNEVDLLDRALKALEQRDAAGAASLLRDYLSDASTFP